ncbi:MAG: type II toxin-antitoxin system VapC family toxin [Chloroflexi bacterium]|nr:type II toxin-antitoxin system VapC family toxin [Chloroflexota bacterium]
MNTRESLHPTAKDGRLALSREQRSVVLTDWVVAETGNGLARTGARGRFVETVEEMRRNPRFRIVAVSPDLMERALLLYAGHSDKHWGLVDCASFVLMKDEGITDAFTTDRHFEQARFNCLLPAKAE